MEGSGFAYPEIPERKHGTLSLYHPVVRQASRGDMICHTRPPLTAMSDYTIYLTDEEAEWIEDRREVSDASSRSEVIRNALAHYRQMVSVNAQEANE